MKVDKNGIRKKKKKIQEENLTEFLTSLLLGKEKKSS